MAKKGSSGFDWAELRVAVISTVPTILIFAVGLGMLLLAKWAWREEGMWAFGLTFVALAVILFVVGWYTRGALRMRFSTKRLRVVWLRPFRMEGKGAFRTSRIIDRLPRSGIIPITLQDGDMKLSLEQLRHRRAGRFWMIFLVQVVVSVSLAVWVWPQEWTFGAWIVLAVVFVLSPFVLLAAWLGAGLLILALEAGVRAFPSLWRDDFKQLERTLERMRRGRSGGGAVVVRIQDVNWREAVTRSLLVSDVILIDVTRLTENVLWELRQLDALQPPPNLVLICRSDLREQEAELRARIAAVLSLSIDKIVYYPSFRRDRGRDFARELVAEINASVARAGR